MHGQCLSPANHIAAFFCSREQIRVVENRLHSTFLYFFLGDKSRSVVPYQGQLNNLLADESVMRATANKAAKAVADSAKATLKTQKGVKQIAKGLVQLKNCLQTFEKTIKL